jgi:hypothetical protein
MKLSDLSFRQHSVFEDGTVATHTFRNGYEASVITGSRAYTSESSPYELAIFLNDKVTKTELGDGIFGWLNEEEVNDLLLKIEALPTV